jgi:long-chain acyl-CoA synthetase
MTPSLSLNIASFLPSVARVHGHRPAVSVAHKVFCTYAELYARVRRLAGALRQDCGLNVGDRVAFAMSNTPQYFELFLACWHAGLCVVPINAKLHPKEFAYIFEDAGARVCFTTPDLHSSLINQVGTAALERVICVQDPAYEMLIAAEPIERVDTAESDLAWLFYTSGTTGRPKGAMLSHRNLMAMALRYYADIDAVDENDCYFHPAPISHGGGLYGLPHLMKGSHQVVPASLGFDVDEIFDLLETYRNVTFYTAPTMLTRLTNSPRAAGARVESIKTIYYGGAPMYVEDLKRSIATFGARLYQIFGQGESPMSGTGLSKIMHVDTGHPRYEQRLGSVGVARTGIEVRVVDADGQAVPPGDLGEVVLRSEVTMMGYWQNPGATASAIRGGWLHTGDMGVLDKDGFLTLRDRSKDMIISGGSNIYPREIEEVLKLDARVFEVSVIGCPHPDWGEEVVACIVRHSGQSVTAEELDRLCLANVARFKRPKAYIFLDTLPKSGYGKILKSELREQVRSRVAPPARPQTSGSGT